MTIKQFSSASQKKAYEKLIETLRNNDYTTKILLDNSYHQKYYKITGIDL